jgi:ESCRT-II complex subunit VPS22
MRRGVGIAAIKERQAMTARAQAVGEALNEAKLKHVSEQIATFKSALEDFATKYRKEINSDPEFRRAFAKMTKSIGVDPLSSAKGFWADALGLGDFYFEIAIQAVEICMSTRAMNGGLISLDELTSRLRLLRGKSNASAAISSDDVKRGLDRISHLGGGFNIITLGVHKYVRSVPEELDADQSIVLSMLSSRSPSNEQQQQCFLTLSMLIDELKWPEMRAHAVCERLLKSGITWLDKGTSTHEARYYVPFLWSQSTTL